MSYVRVDKALRHKPKFRAIQRRTGMDDATIVGHLVQIWALVDELGEEFIGADEDICAAVSAPSALVCALCAEGWATRFEGGISFHSNDPVSVDRADAHRARAARSYERKKQSLRAEFCAPARSAPPTSPPTPPSPTSPPSPHSAQSAPVRAVARPKPEAVPDSIGWDSAGGWRGISDEDRSAWRIAYPACDIDRQLARADQWLRANPEKSKKSRWRRFITGWLGRQQDQGGDIPSNKPAAPNRTEMQLTSARKAWGLDT